MSRTNGMDCSGLIRSVRGGFIGGEDGGRQGIVYSRGNGRQVSPNGPNLSTPRGGIRQH